MSAVRLAIASEAVFLSSAVLCALECSLFGLHLSRSPQRIPAGALCPLPSLADSAPRPSFGC